MSVKLDSWIETETTDVRRMVGEGLSAREIAEELGAPLGSILSAAPDLFDGASGVPEAVGVNRCEGCDRVIEPGSRRCRRCRVAERHRDLIEKVRVMQAAGMGLHEIADELGVKLGTAHWATSEAARQGLHRQRPMRRR